MSGAICWFAISMEQEAQELAKGLRRRDPDLLDRLIQQYHYRLFRYLLMLTGGRETAEDLFQETWIRVLEKGGQYSPRWRFETWLFTIARHLAIDLMRRKQAASLDTLLESAGEAKPLELEAPSDASAFEQVSRSEESVRVAAALGQLPPSYREVMVLRFQEDLELGEIAEITATPVSTVKSRLYRGLETLRELLGEA